LKRARLAELEARGVYTLEADLNDRGVIRKALHPKPQISNPKP